MQAHAGNSGLGYDTATLSRKSGHSKWAPGDHDLPPHRVVSKSRSSSRLRLQVVQRQTLPLHKPVLLRLIVRGEELLYEGVV
jgi:hypothetical protein